MLSCNYNMGWLPPESLCGSDTDEQRDEAEMRGHANRVLKKVGIPSGLIDDQSKFIARKAACRLETGF